MNNSIIPSIVKSYKGRAIRINPDNQYVCLTDMASANNKFYGHWRELKGTKEYLVEFSESIGIPIDDLITTSDNTVANEDRGTWAHPKIAIRFAQWCNVKFAIQVDFWIDELLTTGKVELESQSKPLLIEQSEKVAQSIERIQNSLGRSNPRLAQILVDIGVNDFIESHQPKLAVAEFPEDRWYGLVQIADKMGISTNASTRTKLGQYISDLVKQGILDVDRVQENRLCNGQYREIWCYRDTEAIRSAIAKWSSSIR